MNDDFHSRRILYLERYDDADNHRRKLAGVMRFARTRKWEVEAIPAARWSPAGLPALLRRLRPAGCVVECLDAAGIPSPACFGKTPAVWLDPPEKLRWRGAPAVVCDNAAVARFAFRELAAGLPSCFAAVPSHRLQRWSEERIAAFRALCAEAGAPCHVFEGRTVRRGRPEDLERRRARLAAWLSTLPARCAVFAANDYSARDVALAARSVARSIPRELSLLGVDGMPDESGDATIRRLSSVRMDFELAGYLAAHLLAEANDGGGYAANDGRRCAANDGGGYAANDGGASRQMTNDDPVAIAAAVRTSLPPQAARHCGQRPHVIAAAGGPSLPPQAAAFGPLCVLRGDSTRGRGRRDPHVLEAVGIIRREACEGLTAAALAARVPGSRKHFERRFREAMGHSVLDEILHVRLQAVMDLLSRPEPPIGTLADFCGFGSQVELRIAFRARTGMSMRQWRKNHLG